MNTTNLIRLKQVQSKKDELFSRYLLEKEKFDDEWGHLIDECDELDEQEKELKKLIQTEVVEDYERTGDKEFMGDISVKVYNKVEYDDNDAIEWAKQNCEDVIKHKLNKREFNKIARRERLSFVKKYKEPKVIFPEVIDL